MTSRKEGTEPVVIAFTRGMVIVGELACAVKGRAVPDRMRLESCQCLSRYNMKLSSYLCVNSKPDGLEYTKSLHDHGQLVFGQHGDN